MTENYFKNLMDKEERLTILDGLGILVKAFVVYAGLWVFIIFALTLEPILQFREDVILWQQLKKFGRPLRSKRRRRINFG